MRFGEGIGDVAYFLATALDPKVRRAHETKLLSIYIQGLKDNGTTGIDSVGLLQGYRAHLIYPFEAMVVSLAVGGMIKLEINHELIRQTVAAVEDLAVFSVIRCNAAVVFRKSSRLTDIDHAVLPAQFSVNLHEHILSFPPRELALLSA